MTGAAPVDHYFFTYYVLVEEDFAIDQFFFHRTKILDSMQ
jgi:hypothetical protein